MKLIKNFLTVSLFAAPILASNTLKVEAHNIDKGPRGESIYHTSWAKSRNQGICHKHKDPFNSKRKEKKGGDLFKCKEIKQR